MARTLTRPAQLGLVLVGGMLGGSLRIGIGEVWPEMAGPVPWDLVLINVLGSLALGWASARSRAAGGWTLMPAIGPGLLGGFTTFSSIACLEHSADVPLATSAAILVGTVIAACAGAWLGWAVGDRRATSREERAVFVEENE